MISSTRHPHTGNMQLLNRLSSNLRRIERRAGDADAFLDAPFRPPGACRPRLTAVGRGPSSSVPAASGTSSAARPARPAERASAPSAHAPLRPRPGGPARRRSIQGRGLARRGGAMAGWRSRAESWCGDPCARRMAPLPARSPTPTPSRTPRDDGPRWTEVPAVARAGGPGGYEKGRRPPGRGRGEAGPGAAEEAARAMPRTPRWHDYGLASCARRRGPRPVPARSAPRARPRESDALSRSRPDPRPDGGGAGCGTSAARELQEFRTRAIRHNAGRGGEYFGGWPALGVRHGSALGAVADPGLGGASGAGRSPGTPAGGAFTNEDLAAAGPGAPPRRTEAHALARTIASP
jgi:hypothetical protein